MDGWLSLCFIALSTLLALWFLKLSRGNSNPSKKQLPPGPWTLPIIGSLHHVISALPHRKMMELSRRHGPIMYLRLGEVPTVVVSGPEAASLLMKTNDLAFAGRPSNAIKDIFGSGGKGIAWAPYGDHWRQMRKVCIVEFLSANQVKRMEGIRIKMVGNLLGCITASAGATINVSQKVIALTNDLVYTAAFGGKFTQQDEYLRELAEAMKIVGGFTLVDFFPSSWLVRCLSSGERNMRRSCNRIQRIIADIVEERKVARVAGHGSCNTNDENLLDVLLRQQKEDMLEFPLTTETIGAVLFDVFAGATDTTANLLSWAMSELVRSPETMAKAQQEIREVLAEGQAVITSSDLAKLHYVKMVIKEVLRLHPPFPLIPRKAREDSTILGYDIPKETSIYINVFALSRDPTYGKNHEDFNPERFENNSLEYNGTCFEFIPFGAGRRQCPGIQFSLSTVEMVLTNLLYHFDWMLHEGDSISSFDMSEKFGATVHRRYDLQLRAVPHMWSKAMPSK